MTVRVPHLLQWRASMSLISNREDCQRESPAAVTFPVHRQVVIRILGICSLLIITFALTRVALSQTPTQESRKRATSPEVLAQDYNLDFENRLQGWTGTGSAFDSQPIAGASIRTERVGAVKNIGGDYWRNLY